MLNIMINQQLLSKEVYSFSHENRKISYAPLTRFFSIHDGNSEVDDRWLTDATNIDEVPDFIRQKSFSDERKKLKLRMNITSKCSLNCEYCSVNTEEGKGIDMDYTMALKSIDQFVNYAKEHGMTELELTFSGGEPTLKLEQIEELIIEAEEKLEGTNIKLITKLLTNGLFPENDTQKIVDLFNGIQVSWDGFLESNPRYRKDNKIGQKIWKNIGLLVKGGSKVNIATVVSEDNQNNLQEIIDQLYETYGIEDIFLTLKDNVGKAVNGINIDYEELRTTYIELWKKYRKLDVDIAFTGTDIHSISLYPCGVSVPNFSVSPSGEISACTLTFNGKNNQNSNFDIGKIDSKGLILDNERITKFKAISILSLKECSDCFAKWHCRGGCMYANNEKWLGSINPERCDMVRKIIADKILFIAGNN
ncbi:MAG: radical SAM protein [Candidatus Gracilibacteria bacterium]|nr:radical SAM protein [Candidatus Gracilibacteria bacterium]